MISTISNTELPLINLHRLECELPVEDLRKACFEHGCFSVINTGLGQDLLDDVFRQANHFFALDDDDAVKRAVSSRTSEGGTGWSALYDEPAYTAGTLARMESFDCGPYRSELERLPDARRLGLFPSCWPDLPEFRSTVRACWDGLELLGGALYTGFAKMLGLDPDFFGLRCTSAAPSTLRLIHYPRSESEQAENVVGISEHSDFECFTVIYQTAPGLEVKDVQGRWRIAPAEPGRLIVLLGDMLERWTNGLLQATRHRVPDTRWARNSLVMFYAADADCTVEPLPQFIGPGQSVNYAAITQQAHIRAMMDRAERNSREMS